MKPAERIRKIYAAFDAGASPGALYEALNRVPLKRLEDIGVLLEGFRCSEWRAHLALVRALKSATAFSAVAIPVLIEALDHHEDLVWGAAAESLGAFGARADEAVPHLLRKLHRHHGYSGKPLILALGRIGTRADVVLPALIPLVDTEALGAEACEAFGGFPDRLPEFFAVLRDALRSDQYDTRGAAAAALALHPAPRNRVMDAFVQRLVEEPADHFHILKHLVRFGEETDRVVLTLLRVLDPSTLAPLLKRFRAWSRLADLLGDPELNVRVRAAMLLARSRRRSEVPRLIEALKDVEIRPLVIEALARLGGATAADALEQLHDPQTQDLVRASLRRMGRRPATPPDGILFEGLRQIELPRLAGQRALRIDGKAWFAWHRLLKRSPGSQWRTDVDEFGVGAVDVASGALETWRLPVAFPAQATGASGAKRAFRLEFDMEGALLCVLQDPFADRRGWGSDNYLYVIQDGAWERFVGGKRVPLVPAEREDPAFSACFGEAIVWKENGGVRVIPNGTPYHLDDWEHTKEVSEALAAHSRFEAALPARHVTIASADLWVVDPGRLRLYGPARDASPAFAVEGVVFLNVGGTCAALLTPPGSEAALPARAS